MRSIGIKLKSTLGLFYLLRYFTNLILPLKVDRSPFFTAIKRNYLL